MMYKFGVITIFCYVAIFLIGFLDQGMSVDPTKPTPIPSCEQLNDSCASCLKNVSCLWCNTKVQKCLDYPTKNVLPSASYCALSAARWGVCWLNFEAMIISVSVIGGVLIIGITLCLCKCCGCCCFAKNNSKYLAEQARMDRERQERSMRQDERKQERQRRNDEIRRKYGLGANGGSQYQQFENEADA